MQEQTIDRDGRRAARSTSRSRAARTLAALALLSLVVLAVSAQEPEMNAKRKKLAVGDSAPSFVLPGSDGKDYDSDDLFGKRAVVIAWFPKAFTGG